MKRILSFSLLISSLFFVSSCSKNDEPDVPSQTATVRYEATVDEPENFDIEVHYSKGEFNAGENPSGYEGIKKTVQSPFVSESFQVKSGALLWFYNPQIQISVVSGTKRSIFRQKNKTKRSKKRLHTTLIKPEQKVNEDLCSGFIVS